MSEQVGRKILTARKGSTELVKLDYHFTSDYNSENGWELTQGLAFTDTELATRDAAMIKAAEARQVLDPCCGGRMFYFDKLDNRVLFSDRREEEHVLCDGRQFNVKPDRVGDFRDMPFGDGTFNQIVFDPPHLETVGDKAYMAKKYGKLDKQTWREDLGLGFDECWRVLAPGGTLIFKWNETQIKLREVLACFSQRPLFGHTTTQNLKTHWMSFYKPTPDTAAHELDAAYNEGVETAARVAPHLGDQIRALKR